jgi:hypothetical protein
VSATLSYTATAVGIVFLFHRVTGRSYRETLVVRRADLARIAGSLRGSTGRTGKG